MKTDRIIIILTFALLLAPCALRAEDTNSASGLDYNSFSIISTRNIFNPNRRNYVRRDGPQTRIDSFTFVGTMTYDKGRFAFFEGTSSEYKKSLKVADVIAGYRVADIGENSVTLLAAGNKELKLTIGEQMKRTDGGPWTLLAHAEATRPSANPGEPAGFTERAANLNGAQSDVLKRMMMRRLKEQQ